MPESSSDVYPRHLMCAMSTRPWTSKRSSALGAIATLLTIGATVVQADDWPEWRGQGRVGVWRESGIVETFPDAGLRVAWRAPLNRG